MHSELKKFYYLKKIYLKPDSNVYSSIALGLMFTSFYAEAEVTTMLTDPETGEIFTDIVRYGETQLKRDKFL